MSNYLTCATILKQLLNKSNFEIKSLWCVSTVEDVICTEAINCNSIDEMYFAVSSAVMKYLASQCKVTYIIRPMVVVLSVLKEGRLLVLLCI